MNRRRLFASALAAIAAIPVFGKVVKADDGLGLNEPQEVGDLGMLLRLLDNGCTCDPARNEACAHCSTDDLTALYHGSFGHEIWHEVPFGDYTLKFRAVDRQILIP